MVNDGCGAFFFSAGQALADVSHEVIIGIEGDSSTEVKDSLGNLSLDQSDNYKVKNSLFRAQYTRFFDPLKDDDTPIELRRFLQHPTTVTTGIMALGQTVEDNTISTSRTNTETQASFLVLGGEYFFPTNTGLFLNLPLGSGKYKQKVNDVSQVDMDLDASNYELGVRQYLVPSVEVHLAFSGDSTRGKQDSFETTQKRALTLLGVKGVIASTVGLSFEIGGGKRKATSTGSPDEDFDAGRIQAGIAVYAGKNLSFSLDIKGDAAKQTGMASVEEHTESTARATLAATYWFNERFGLQLPIYSETTETKNIIASLEAKHTEKKGGIGLYAAFRF